MGPPTVVLVAELLAEIQGAVGSKLHQEAGPVRGIEEGLLARSRVNVDGALQGAREEDVARAVQGDASKCH